MARLLAEGAEKCEIIRHGHFNRMTDFLHDDECYITKHYWHQLTVQWAPVSFCTWDQSDRDTPAASAPQQSRTPSSSDLLDGIRSRQTSILALCLKPLSQDVSYEQCKRHLETHLCEKYQGQVRMSRSLGHDQGHRNKTASLRIPFTDGLPFAKRQSCFSLICSQFLSEHQRKAT